MKSTLSPVETTRIGKKRKRDQVKDARTGQKLDLKRDQFKDADAFRQQKRLYDREYQLGRRGNTRVAQEELKSVIPKDYLDVVDDINDIKIFRGGKSFDMIYQ